MKYKLCILIPYLVYADSGIYSISLEIQNKTQSEISFEYKANTSSKSQLVKCAALQTCSLKWKKSMPFKVDFSKIKCAEKKCYYKARPLKHHTLHAISSDNAYTQNKLTIEQSWPFNIFTIKRQPV